MPYETFIAPTERPATSLDVKRALLTFDKVYLPDPSDRDVIPPQSFMIAIGMPPIFGLNAGPVRPLGKAPGYNHDFDKLMDELEIARRQNLVDVISTYELATSSEMTLGAVRMGEYPLNPSFMLWAYRAIARDNEALTIAIHSDPALSNSSDEFIDSIANAGGKADGNINNDPALPLLQGELARDHLRNHYSVIARSRIASVMKSIGFCASKQMIPVFSDAAYNSISNHMALRASRVVDAVSEFDPYWSQRSQALRVAHEEYVDETVLNQMSIDDVLRLRTTAWGEQATARDSLLESVAELTKEAAGSVDFEAVIREKIMDYGKTYDEIQRERSALHLKIECDLLKVGGALALSVLTGTTVSGLFTQVQSGFGAALLLLTGCLYAIEKIKDYKPAVEQMRAVEEEFSDNACVGMHNFYSRIHSVTKG